MNNIHELITILNELKENKKPNEMKTVSKYIKVTLDHPQQNSLISY